MADNTTAASIDEYIASFPPEGQGMLEEMRALIRAAASGSTERISYGIPTFDLNGKYLVYFAGWKNHISIYPAPAGDAAFEEALRSYKRAKGTVRFPLDEPLPVDLIRRIVELRVAEVTRAALQQGSLASPEGK